MCVTKMSWAFYFLVNSCEFLLGVKQFLLDFLFPPAFKNHTAAHQAQGAGCRDRAAPSYLLVLGFFRASPQHAEPWRTKPQRFPLMARDSLLIPWCACPQLRACPAWDEQLPARQMWKTTALNCWEIQNFSMHGSQQGCSAVRKYSDTDPCSVFLLRVWLGEGRDNKIPDLASNNSRRQEKGKGKKPTSELGVQMVVWDLEYFCLTCFISRL